MNHETALCERFLEVARLAADAMLLVVDGVIVAANGATRERLWFVPGPLEGRCLVDLSVDPPLCTEYLRRCARSAEPVAGAIVFSWKPNGSVPIQSWGACFAETAGGLASPSRGPSAVALRLESEGPASERCLQLDHKIDELRREIKKRIATESALRESQERLRIERARLCEAEAEARALAERANRAKDELLSILSHELRTPLTAILGWANVLRTTRPEPARVARALEAIDRNARRQTRIIEDILDVGMIVADKMQLEVGPVDPAAVARSAVDAVRPSAEAKRIALKAAIDPEVGMIRGDPGRLEQVAMHLLSNAIKFTPEGGLIAVDLFRRGQRVHLRVSDTGIGIAPELLPHVFERFRQADSSNTRAYGGLGLGLSIVEHLVELHEGTVTAESEGLGFGAVFTVSLPVP